MPLLVTLLFLESWNAEMMARNVGLYGQAQHSRFGRTGKEETPGCLRAQNAKSMLLTWRTTCEGETSLYCLSYCFASLLHLTLILTRTGLLQL